MKQVLWRELIKSLYNKDFAHQNNWAKVYL